MEEVILVDESDRQIGLEEKLSAHQNGGKLHRAISIFVFNKKGELMLQKRAHTKYHAPNMWSSTCCSHPRDKEPVANAAHRRLAEEMGFDCELKEVCSFIYKASMENGLTEWEFDHFFGGTCEKEPKPNKEEVGDWKWIGLEALYADIKKNPQSYSKFFLSFYSRAVDEMRRAGFTR